MHYCKRCINGFTSDDALKNHKKYCDQQDAVRREYPEPNTMLSFNHYNRSMRVPFVIYADFESCIKPNIRVSLIQTSLTRISTKNTSLCHFAYMSNVLTLVFTQDLQ